MDSEIVKIYTVIGMVMTIFALLIFSFTGIDYIKAMFILYILIGGILSFLGGALLSWGKTGNPSHFIICLFMFCIIPLALASVMHYYVITPLKAHGLLSPLNIVLFLTSITLLFIYVKYYEKYNWKTYYIQEGKQLDIDILSIQLIGTKPYLYSGWFMNKSYLFNINRVNEKKKWWDTREYQYTGLPKGLKITYFSTKEQQLYQGQFKLKKRKIRTLMGLTLFFPLFRLQKYDHLNLLLFTKGEISVQLGNYTTDINFFDGICTPITVEILSNQQARVFEKNKSDIEINSLGQNNDMSDDLNLIRKQKLHIRHTITGLTHKIVSINVITTSGERYTLTKKQWNGKTLSKMHAPIALINLIIINNKGQKLSWEYVYDICDIANHFKNNELITDINYTFHLYTSEDKSLLATSFEYLNGEKNEFKLTDKGVTVV